MAGPIEMTDAGKNVGMPVEASSRAPERPGYTIVQDFGDGSAIYRFDETGNETYVSARGQSITDPATIKAIKESGSQAAGQISKEGFAREGLGERATKFMTLMSNMPFLRGYTPDIFSAGAGDAASPELVNLAVSARKREAPVTSALSGMAAAAPLAAVAGAPVVGGNILRQMLFGGATAAAAGGAEGVVAGYGAGGTERALEEGKAGAIGGGLFGTALPGVGAVAGAAYGRYLEKPFKSVLEEIGFKGKAAEIAKDFLAMDAADAVENVGTAGPYGTVATMGPSTSSLLDYVANTPGEGANIVRSNLKESANDAATDLRDTMDILLGKPKGDAVSQKTDIMEASRDARKATYGEAYDAVIDATTAEGRLATTLFNQVPPRIVARINETLSLEGLPTIVRPGRYTEAEFNALQASGQPLQNVNVRTAPDGSYIVESVPTIENIDDVSRVLYNMSRGITEDPGAKMALQSLSMQLRQAADQISPAFKKARAEGKSAIDQRMAVDFGDSLLNPRVTREEVNRVLAGMGPTEISQVKQALRNRLDELAANARKSPTGQQEQEVIEALAQLRVMGSRANAEKLRALLGEEDFKTFSDQINATQGALMMNAAIATNSKTYIRGMVNDRVKQIVGASLGEEIGKQGVMPTIVSKTSDALLSGAPEAERVRAVGAELAPVLTRRMTPEDLLAQARALEAATPALSRAARGRQQARSAVSALGMPAAVTQGQEDSSTRRLLQSLGLNQLR